jgi:small nuclear ribonucleoprotein (snRNP)-like protein
MMIESLIGETVVIDLRSEYVCMGVLKAVDPHFLELKNVDLHDLRDSDSTRENYVHASARTGIKRNRRKLFLRQEEIVSIAKLSDVVEG